MNDVHPEAGRLADPAGLVDVARLITAYYAEHPDPAEPSQRVAFGTSGHRGSALSLSFNDDHIAATSQAICEYRAAQGIDGPLFLAKDTHALSEPAAATAVEVFAANGVTLLLDSRDGYTPTPSLSRAVLVHNRGRLHTQGAGLADGVVITPSHNPPSDGGFKYNPPHGGPADTDATGWIQNRANDLLAAGLDGVQPDPAGAGARRRDHRVPTTSSTATSPTCRWPSTWTRSAPPACASARTRSAGRASPTGARSATATAWTSRS